MVGNEINSIGFNIGLSNFVDYMPDMVAYWDKDLINRYANAAYAAFAGKELKEIIGRHMAEILPATVVAESKSFIENAKLGQVQLVEKELYNPTTSVHIFCLLRSQPDFVNGECKGYFIQVTDITTRKRKEYEAGRNLIRLREAQAAAKIGSWDFNLKTKEAEWSSENYRIFGIEEPQAPDKLFEMYRSRLHVDDIQLIDELIARAIATGEGYEYQHRIVLPDGQVKRLKGIGKVKLDRSGLPESLSGVCIDETADFETRQFQNRLLEQNKSMVKSAKFSIITADLDGLITGFSAESERILGYSADEVVGKTNPGIFHDPDEVVRVAAELSKEFSIDVKVGFETFIFKAQNGSYDERQWTYIRKDGTRVQVRLNVTALADESGQIYGYMGIARDLTDELKMQESLNLERAKSLKNAKLASLGEMAAGIAHEINNPLAVISSSVGLLEKFRQNEEKFSGKIEAIRNSTNRVSRIVSSLKKFSRTGDRSLYKPNSLKMIFEDALVLTEAKLQRNNVQLTQCCAEPDVLLVCDDVEIGQVMVNLINNAADAVKDLAERWIRVSAEVMGGEVVIRVMDSGAGIPETVRHKLFEPFFTTKQVGEGTGLGLSITKGILDEHKATIALIDDLPHTCFELRFQNPEA